MAIGPSVRRLMGRQELPLTLLYRSILFDMREFVDVVKARAPAHRILEIGCGEGLLAKPLSNGCPNTTVLGIHGKPGVGRLFQGDGERVRCAWMATDALLSRPAEAS